MRLNEIRQKFLDFFKSKGHTIIPSASLIPEDKTVLFNTAGMQPLVPYLLGREHPKGRRLANAQKCLRTDDIAEVGDNRHLTFFEMLGNWSLGDPSAPDGIGAGYFKKESIAWSFELLTSKKWFAIPAEKLYVTVFEGDATMGIARDNESISYWKEAFASVGMDASLENGRISAYPKKKNWWELAGPGPCGPDTEIFYDTLPNFPLEISGGQAGNPHDPKLHGNYCHANCDCGRFVEIWNNVFMEYEKKQNDTGGWFYAPLAQKNVDTGMGLERIAMVLQGKETVFDTDLFTATFPTWESDFQVDRDSASNRIIADHLRASVFLLADGVRPSNKDAGYILRRLIRRALVHAKKIPIPSPQLQEWIENIISNYGGFYSELIKNKPEILKEFNKENEQFVLTLEKGMKEFERRYPRAEADFEPFPMFYIGKEVGQDAFDLYQTYGFPIEVIKELLIERSYQFNEKEFNQKVAEELKKHQEISRVGAEKKFGGHGLILQTGELKAANEEELKKVTRLHTATHLLQAALRAVLGPHVHQRGSDITAERLRFDFSHPQKMTDEEKKKVEDLVNEQIQKGLPMMMQELPIEEAEKTGALMFQKEKYGATVKVYSAGEFSKELCGGPHVDNTSEVGQFKILKEEAISAGVRRIRAAVR